MKKFIAVAAILSVMFLGTGTSQALVGMPDAVPGTDILVPFFLVSMPGCGNENTLITITEVKGIPTELFFWMQDIDSQPVWDDTCELTANDVYVTDALTYIVGDIGLGTPEEIALQIDLNPAIPGNDHWAGYIYYFNDTTTVDNLMAHAYQVSIPEGMAAEYLPPSLEFDNAADPRQTSNFGDEAFSANSLWVGKNLLAGFGAPAADANFFRLMPRYYIHDANSVNYLIIWTESNFSGIPVPGTVHCDFWNEEEISQSKNLYLDHELNIIELDMIPVGIFPLGHPYAGWINIETPCLFFGATNWATDANANGILDGAERDWLGYSYQKAVGAAAETWDVIFEMHRETND